MAEAIDTQKSIMTYLWGVLTGDTTGATSLQALMGGAVRLYLTWAVPDADFPYLVHRLDISADSDAFPIRQATYYLDIWSYSTKADEILSIRKRIIELLDELGFTTAEVGGARLWLQTDGFIPETEQDIYHYAMQFNLRYYRKSETAAIISR